MTMMTIGRRIFGALALTTSGLFLTLVMLVGDASGQQPTFKEQLVGTWKIVSITQYQDDGKKIEPYGPNPKGIIILDRNGRYSLLLLRPGLPKVASNNRETATPEETKTIVQGSLGHFGTYSINEADRTFTIQIESSTFANWDGTVQKRVFTLEGDQLKYTNPVTAMGRASSELVWQRVK